MRIHLRNAPFSRCVRERYEPDTDITCFICGHGIFRDEEIAWMGQYPCHAECMEETMDIKEFMEARAKQEQSRVKNYPPARMPTDEEIRVFTEQMIELSKETDIEDRHISMDGLMCDLLESLGFGEGVEIFHSTEKWHS